MQKAINELVDYVAENDKLTISFETVTMAIAALEKQMPKKPFKPFGTHSYKCSNCWKFVAHEVDDDFDLANLAEWCPYCGQKIGWSEVEE